MEVEGEEKKRRNRGLIINKEGNLPLNGRQRSRAVKSSHSIDRVIKRGDSNSISEKGTDITIL